jgi:hypothetical protein
MARLLPEDGKRHEVIDGEWLATPAPTQRRQRAMEFPEATNTRRS